ncbi:C39 family peptidase [Paraburkholderia phosphatilytica]|uniref:C39 family peptidase n=1 Tax=Paraburkholderia phosphatilytica TaxID=2282883 RepID=UPI000E4E856F|nr:C39 family peptidase [Paraburkholderia phosphatilytica]
MRYSTDDDRSVAPFGVPYYTQWGSPEWVRAIAEEGADPCDDPGWRRSGFTDAARYRFWSQRLCGLTCLESALDFWGIGHPSQAAMLDDALRRGVYKLRDDGGVDGLIYRPFADWVGDAFGVTVDVLPDVALTAIAESLDRETFAIVSVSPEIRRPERPNTKRGGHLILLHGRDAEGVWFHNPSGVPPWQADARLPFDTMERFYAGRGMVLRRCATARAQDERAAQTEGAAGTAG